MASGGRQHCWQQHCKCSGRAAPGGGGAASAGRDCRSVLLQLRQSRQKRQQRQLRPSVSSYLRPSCWGFKFVPSPHTCVNVSRRHVLCLNFTAKIMRTAAGEGQTRRGRQNPAPPTQNLLKATIQDINPVVPTTGWGIPTGTSRKSTAEQSRIHPWNIFLVFRAANPRRYRVRNLRRSDRRRSDGRSTDRHQIR